MHRNTTIALLLIGALLLGAPSIAAREGNAHCDFNGDSFDDAAIGSPGEGIAGAESAGAVNILYGSTKGLTAAGSQLWTQNTPGIADSAEEQDNFGTGVECGDFNGDGFADLVIGVIGETIGEHFRAGAFHVLFGSGDGLTAEGSLFLHRNVPGVAGAPEFNPGFSNSLAVGDFNADGLDDLAIGAPFDRVGEFYSAGSVQVFMGDPNGLSTEKDKIWHRARQGIKGEPGGAFFGLSLTTGDFNGDGHDDLAIGAPYAKVGDITDAGSVNVLYGSEAGLTAVGDQLLHRSTQGIKGSANFSDLFGRGLAAGDFDNDGFDDIAIGVTNDRANEEAGSIHVLRGSDHGLKRAGDILWDRDTPGIKRTPERGDWFGGQLAAGHFDDDPYEDLAVSVQGDNIGAALEAGSVQVLHGSETGLSTRDQVWHQGTAGIKGSDEAFDFWGTSMAVGDYDGNDLADLCVGVPGEDRETKTNYGRVAVIYADSGGLNDEGNQSWSQRNPDIPGGAESGDGFGGRVSGSPSR